MSKKGKSGKLLKRIVTGVVILALGIGGYFGWIYYNSFFKANIDTGGKEVSIFIPKGADTKEVIDLIDAKGILKDRGSLEQLADIKNYRGGNIVPGKYKLSDGMTNNQLVNHLRAGNGRLDSQVTFSLVRDLKQLAGAMTKEIEPDSAEDYQWLTNPDSIGKYGFNQQTIISMLIPNTYFVDWDITTPELMARMGKEYKKFWTDARKQKLARTGLTQSQVATLASIVYWETKLPKDMRTIAGVYMNRLDIGMPLQADPTLIFALGDYSIKRVLNKHKEIDSPYNTYKNRGLPPGPVLVAPIQYMDAVLDYEDHDYLYFVAKEDFSGESYFAKTYSQHLIYARRYQKALNERNIYR